MATRPGLLSEVRPFLGLVAEQMIPRQVFESKHLHRHPVLLIPGFCGHANGLYRLRQYFEGEGIRAYHADIGWHMRPYRTTIAMIRAQIERSFHSGELIQPIGFSLGGAIVLLMLATELQERMVNPIIVGTPLFGTPQRSLAYAVEKTTGISRELFFQMRERIELLPHRITAVVPRRSDGIAPPERCSLRKGNVRHVRLAQVFPKKRLGHVDLFSDRDVWRLIATLIKEDDGGDTEPIPFHDVEGDGLMLFQNKPAILTPSISTSMQYQVQDFKLPSLSGLSEKLIVEHLKLYAGYVKNVNVLREKIEEYKKDSEQHALDLSELTRRFAFEWNGMRMHEYYFEALGGEGLKTGGRLAEMLGERFGSFDGWLTEFRALAAMRGIGWVVLARDARAGALFNIWVSDHEIGHLAGADVILALDLWEHAYLFDYLPAQKKDYVSAFFENLRWDVIESRLRVRPACR